jgi:hypothetical protein
VGAALAVAGLLILLVSAGFHRRGAARAV